MWIGSGIAGADKMLFGKTITKNIRTFGICAIELLRSIFGPSSTCKDLHNKLHEFSATNCLTEHWIENFTYPVFLILQYTHTAREGARLKSVHMYGRKCCHNSLLHGIRSMLERRLCTCDQWGVYQRLSSLNIWTVSMLFVLMMDCLKETLTRWLLNPPTRRQWRYLSGKNFRSHRR